MFKIGAFLRVCQVPVKTLRYYDEIGLLQPAQVDESTGYRLYSLDQLPRLNMILALRDLGFSLEQVAALMQEAVSVEQVRGMLRMKRAEIEDRLEAERDRLVRVEHRLNMIEREGRMPAYEIVIKRGEPMRVAAIRDVVENYGSVGALIGELFAVLGEKGIAPTGPSLAIYYDLEYQEHDVDVEAAVPVGTAAKLPAEGRVTIRELPGYPELASLVRPGPYDDFTPAYGELMKWIESNGYRIAGPNREIYLRGPGEDVAPESYVTEIQFPIMKA
jgi:effector-binding domain-containing protein